MIPKCPKCGEEENLHYNLDWSKNPPPVMNILCNECGEFFDTDDKRHYVIKPDIEGKTTFITGSFGNEIYVEDSKEGGFTAYFEDFPNILAEGETKEEARKNLWSAAHDVLKYLMQK
jgi:predicted RNase H-like HicB family nuclease